MMSASTPSLRGFPLNVPVPAIAAVPVNILIDTWKYLKDSRGRGGRRTGVREGGREGEGREEGMAMVGTDASHVLIDSLLLVCSWLILQIGSRQTNQFTRATRYREEGEEIYNGGGGGGGGGGVEREEERIDVAERALIQKLFTFATTALSSTLASPSSLRRCSEKATISIVSLLLSLKLLCASLANLNIPRRNQHNNNHTHRINNNNPTETEAGEGGRRWQEVRVGVDLQQTTSVVHFLCIDVSPDADDEREGSEERTEGYGGEEEDEAPLASLLRSFLLAAITAIPSASSRLATLAVTLSSTCKYAVDSQQRSHISVRGSRPRLLSPSHAATTVRRNLLLMHQAERVFAPLSWRAGGRGGSQERRREEEEEEKEEEAEAEGRGMRDTGSMAEYVTRGIERQWQLLTHGGVAEKDGPYTVEGARQWKASAVSLAAGMLRAWMRTEQAMFHLVGPSSSRGGHSGIRMDVAVPILLRKMVVRGGLDEAREGMQSGGVSRLTTSLAVANAWQALWSPLSSSSFSSLSSSSLSRRQDSSEEDKRMVKCILLDMLLASLTDDIFLGPLSSCFEDTMTTATERDGGNGRAWDALLSFAPRLSDLALKITVRETKESARRRETRCTIERGGEENLFVPHWAVIIQCTRLARLARTLREMCARSEALERVLRRQVGSVVK